MTFWMACRECRGEGWRTQPPYDPKYHERPFRWRAKDPCDACGGTGLRPAAPAEIARHLGTSAPQVPFP